MALLSNIKAKAENIILNAGTAQEMTVPEILEDINLSLEDKADKSDTYTKNEVDTAIETATGNLGTASQYNAPQDGDPNEDLVVLDNDSRLSNAREPLAHTHTASDITDIDEYINDTVKEDIIASDIGAIDESEKGEPNGVATLDNTGHIPSSQLPGSVDEIINGYYNQINGKFYKENTYETEILGEGNKIYVSLDTNIPYRWSGIEFVVIPWGLALGATHETAAYGDEGQAAYHHAIGYHSSAYVESGLYKIGVNNYGHVTSATIVTKEDITDLGIPGEEPDLSDYMMKGFDYVTAGHLTGVTTTDSGRRVTEEGYETISYGNYGHAEGSNTVVVDEGGHAEGVGSSASFYAHAEGINSYAAGAGSHAEGSSYAGSDNAHSEGYGTAAYGSDFTPAHAEGSYTYAGGAASHAEGENTCAIGNNSHAEGRSTEVYGASSHAEGHYTYVSGDWSHGEGYMTKVYASCAHAEGQTTTAQGKASHTEGYKTSAYGKGAHAEGGDFLNKYTTLAYGDGSHAEGSATSAYGVNAHAEGTNTCAYGNGTHAEGGGTTASGVGSHSEGIHTYAAGDYSHAEGYQTYARQSKSHAEGDGTKALSLSAHAEGSKTTADGSDSHAEGGWTKASGESSHAEGWRTIASNFASHAGGHYSAAMTDGGFDGNKTGTAFIIGNGTSLQELSNAFSVQYDGTVSAAGAQVHPTADYAEFFEWIDGNVKDDDRVGYFVTTDKTDPTKITLAEAEDDYILGIVSGAPCVIGNGDCDVWNGMMMRDEFGRVIYEEPGVPKYNPKYDPSQPYISRMNRKEWAAVGMLGVLPVRDDGTCQVGGFCTVGARGTATKADRYDKNSNCYKVIERINNKVIKVIFK